MSDWIAAGQAAKIAKVNRSTVYRWAQLGYLSSKTEDGTLKVSREEVMASAAQGKKPKEITLQRLAQRIKKMEGKIQRLEHEVYRMRTGAGREPLQLNKETVVGMLLRAEQFLEDGELTLEDIDYWVNISSRMTPDLLDIIYKTGKKNRRGILEEVLLRVLQDLMQRPKGIPIFTSVQHGISNLQLCARTLEDSKK
jgi:hypothetical protein